MIPAVSQAKILIHAGLTNSPILRRSPVKRIKGITANASCRLNTTWLMMSSFAVPLSPYIAVTITAGTMAMPRVMSRRSHGRNRRFRKPSITICPASVPVSVEFWPDASSATANNTLATPTPSVGESSL